MEVQRQRTRTLVECRGQAYDCCIAAKVLHSTRAGLAGGNPPAPPAFYLNRRMRNRTYGGVRGLRGQPLTLLDVRPAGRTYLEVKVLYSPGKGKS